MAGRSQRFKDAGFKIPKFMLPLGDSFIFDYAVSSFRDYFLNEHFLFILNNNPIEIEFTKQRITALNIKSWSITEVSSATNGQADTVNIGLQQTNQNQNEELIIFNIDTFKNHYQMPSFIKSQNVDGFLETFMGTGNGWSYVEPNLMAETSTVLRTAEKDPISNLACTGLYYFRNRDLFVESFKIEEEKFLNSQLTEIYIAPMYNSLILKGLDIRYSIVSKENLIFCGIPSEYSDVQQKLKVNKRLF